MRRSSALLCASALALSALSFAASARASTQPSASAASADPFAAELEAIKAEARARAHSPEAALPLLRAFALREKLSTLAPLAQLYRQYADWSVVPPEVRALSRMLLAQIERSRGRMSRSQDALGHLGTITAFHAIGPFDNEGKSGCDTVYPPEREVDLAARYPGKSREVGWRRIPEGAPLGYVNLGELFNPSDETVIYALTILEANEDRKAEIHLGASGASRLWVNGTRVYADDAYHPPRFDQGAVTVSLRKGTNRVLLKLCQSSGPHGFFLRAVGPDGRATPGLSASAPEVLPAAPAGSVAKEALPSLVDWFRKRAEASRGDGRARAEYAEILLYRQAFDSASRLDAAEAAKAAKLAPHDAGIQLLAARTADDHNDRRAYLEAALAASPSQPEASLELARHALGLGYPRRALDVIEPALARSPGYYPLALAKVAALEAIGLEQRAEKLMRQLGRAFSDRPEVIREMASLERRREHLAEACALYRVAIGLRYDDLEARRSLAAILTDRGDVKAALEELRAVNALEPLSVASWLRTGELAASNGLEDEAREAFARAVALAPEDADVHERRGQALARLGDRGGAIASLSQALELKPQNPQVKEALKALRGESRGFGEELARDPARLVAESPALEGEDAVVLSEIEAIKVFPSGLASRFHQAIVRVQTPRGVESERSQWITYSPDRQDLRILKARLIRPDGSIVESHSESDRSLSDGSTRLYYDARARLIGFPTLAPGDVIELSYRLDDTANDNLLSDYFGDVQMVQGDTVKAAFDYYLFAPKGRPIYSNQPAVALEKTEQAQPDGSTLYHWSGRSIPKQVPEPGMPGFQEIAEPLHVSTYKDWDAVGRYYWGLVRDQLKPGDELKATVEELRKGLPPGDEMAVIRAVYAFVVGRTRYVGLEFGIHGFKPYKVDRVLARRFGDCKDKASLMHAMLEVAGIDSRLVLLRMKRLGAIKPFPASLAVFDHAILYVPKHDLWLDGTAELHGTHELPTQDRGATVLVIQPDGGSQLGQIPEAKAADNWTRSEHHVVLARTGQATLQGRTTVGGLNAPNYRHTYQAPATRKQAYEQGWARVFPGLSVKELELSDLTDIERPVELTYTMEVPRYAQALERESLDFSPFGQGQSYVESYAPLSARKHDLVLGNPWTSRSSFRIELPAGYEPAALPKKVEIQSPFGGLSLDYRAEKGALLVDAEVSIAVAKVSAAEYPAFRAFLGQIDQALGRKLRLEGALSVPRSAQAQ